MNDDQTTEIIITGKKIKHGKKDEITQR